MHGVTSRGSTLKFMILSKQGSRLKILRRLMTTSLAGATKQTTTRSRFRSWRLECCPKIWWQRSNIWLQEAITKNNTTKSSSSWDLVSILTTLSKYSTLSCGGETIQTSTKKYCSSGKQESSKNISLEYRNIFSLEETRLTLSTKYFNTARQVFALKILQQSSSISKRGEIDRSNTRK